MFTPPPKVRSGVLRLIRNFRKELRCGEAAFRKTVKTAFGQRRKTLRNSLAPLIGPHSPAKDSPLLSERPERLSVEQFEDLASMIFPFGGNSEK